MRRNIITGHMALKLAIFIDTSSYMYINNECVTMCIFIAFMYIYVYKCYKYVIRKCLALHDEDYTHTLTQSC